MTVGPQPVARPFPGAGGAASARAAVAAVRPRQWTKNTFVLAGVVFAGRVGDAASWRGAGTALAAYCALSAAAYLGNDVRDCDADRRHPVKRLRPVAQGALSSRAALSLAAMLATGGLALAALLGTASLALAVGFALLQAAYSTLLKRVPLVDLVAIAGLFVIRAAAGAAAIHVPVSGWLLACTALVAVFLGLAKRRGELLLAASGATPGRRSLSLYSIRWLERGLAGLAAVTVLTYVVYAATAHDSWELVLTVPPVAFGVLRYLKLVRSRGIGEEPERVLLSDVPIMLTVVLWASMAAVILGT